MFAGVCSGGIMQFDEPYANTIFDSLKLTLPDCLSIGVPRLVDIAVMTGTSVRSLQRKLSTAGMTYSRLLALARFENAAALLRDSDIKLIDVAFAAGYTDPAHFSRAFRRMSGMTPRKFRSQRSSGKKTAGSAIAEPGQYDRHRALTIGTETRAEREPPPAGGTAPGGRSLQRNHHYHRVGADNDRSKASTGRIDACSSVHARTNETRARRSGTGPKSVSPLPTFGNENAP